MKIALDRGFVDRFLKVNVDFYHENHNLQCEIEWENKEEKIIKMEEISTLRIVTSSSASVVWHHYGLWKADADVVRLEELTVDGKTSLNNLKPIGDLTESEMILVQKRYPDRLPTHVCLTQLVPGRTYEIVRKISRSIDLKDEPYLKRTSGGFVKEQLNLVVTNRASGLKVHIKELGMPKRFNPQGMSTQTVRYDGLLLPFEGFIFIFSVNNF